MELAEILEQLAPWRMRQQRPAWRPITTDGERADSPSQFGGTPWLARDETWPVCGNCQNPLPFFLQLDLASLPAALDGCFGEGLLQLFYCTECDDGWEPFSAIHHVRIVPLTHLAHVSALPPGVECFPAKAIIGWEEFIDLPHPPEHETSGLRYVYDYAANCLRIECPEVGLIAEYPIGDDNLTEAIGTAASGDKLGGWPCWVQNEEYPSCTRCGRKLRLVFQLDSEDNLPFMFGDVGIGHVTQCPDHRDVVTFAWACS